jgi:hypothetical protein
VSRRNLTLVFACAVICAQTGCAMNRVKRNTRDFFLAVPNFIFESIENGLEDDPMDEHLDQLQKAGYGFNNPNAEPIRDRKIPAQPFPSFPDQQGR